jgi:uncharacterized protein
MSFTPSAKVDSILAHVVQWAVNRADIQAVVLVGSWARGTARLDSDIDLMLLTPYPKRFQDSEKWINEINWQALGYEINGWEDKEYGVIWSRHVYLQDGTEIEFSFGAPSWASTQPIDEGTCRVIRDGCCVLYDPKSLISELIAKVKFK